MRVMIVEDQTMIRSLLESYFRVEDGYRITASIPGAKQAVEVCRTSSVEDVYKRQVSGKEFPNFQLAL